MLDMTQIHFFSGEILVNAIYDCMARLMIVAALVCMGYGVAYAATDCEDDGGCENQINGCANQGGECTGSDCTDAPCQEIPGGPVDGRWCFCEAG